MWATEQASATPGCGQPAWDSRNRTESRAPDPRVSQTNDVIVSIQVSWDLSQCRRRKHREPLQHLQLQHSRFNANPLNQRHLQSTGVL